MKNFCTDIQETAKLRGLTIGAGPCRSRNGSYTTTVSHSTETISITIGKDLLRYRDEVVRDIVKEEVNKELKKVFSEVITPKQIETENTNILDTIIKQFIG